MEDDITITEEPVNLQKNPIIEEESKENDLKKFDKVFDVFFHKHKTGIYAYDLPCQHLKTKKIELQCRSADELATTKFLCLDCEIFIE